MSNLPEEVWVRILSNFSITGKATRSDAETWADISNTGGNALHLADDWGTHSLIAQNLRHKAPLCRVSRLFYRICKPLLLELIDVQSFKSFQALCRKAAESEDFANDLAQYTLRLDVKPFHLPEEEAAQLCEDIRVLFRTCRRLKFVSWLVPGYEDLGSKLFHDLPELCPLVEVLFWYGSRNVRLSVLDKLTSLRVFHYESGHDEQHQLDAGTLKLPLVHTLRISSPLFAHFTDPDCLPNLSVLHLSDFNSLPSRFDHTLPLLAHGHKIRTLGFLQHNQNYYRQFPQLCSNTTHVVMDLSTAAYLCMVPWPTVECMDLILEPRMSQMALSFHRSGAWAPVEHILKHKAQNLPMLREIRILDPEIVHTLRSRLSKQLMKPSLVMQLCDGIEVLDETAKPVWNLDFDFENERSEQVPASATGPV